MACVPQFVLGVDTHKDVHVAVLLDRLGRYLATASLAPPTPPTATWSPGAAATVRSPLLAWKAPAATATGSPST